jgi:putative oxidoreductase
MKIPFLIGRILFGGFFVYNGIHHLVQRKKLAEYAGAKSVQSPEAAVVVSGLAVLAGGGSILLGLKPKAGTSAIIGFLSVVSPVMHDFWNAQEEGQRMIDMINFSKNMALLGAALALMGVEEPWPVSVHQEEPSAPAKVIQMARRLVA